MEDKKCKENITRDDGYMVPTENKLSLKLQKCIKNLIQEENLNFYSIEKSDVSTNGGNYLGILQTVDIKGKGPYGDKEINLFVKNIVDCGENFICFSLPRAYLRESFMYKEVLPIYDNLQDEYNIPDEERLKVVKSYSDVNAEVIILENMSEKGFDTGDRRDVISVEFAEMSISQLAKFHALSFVLERSQPKYFEKNIETMESPINFDADWQGFLNKMCCVAVECLEGQSKTKLNNHIPVFMKKYETYYKTNKGHEDAICLCHGDFRANNLLQKKINGKLSEVNVVDFQFASYTCPVFDLIYFIFAGTDQAFRNAHMEHLKNFYYGTFEKFLGHFGIRSSDVYSRSKFESDFKKKLDFGLIVSVFLLPFLFTTDDDVPDISDVVESSTRGLSLEKEYNERIREAVEYFIREGYL